MNLGDSNTQSMTFYPWIPNSSTPHMQNTLTPPQQPRSLNSLQHPVKSMGSKRSIHSTRLLVLSVLFPGLWSPPATQESSAMVVTSNGGDSSKCPHCKESRVCPTDPNVPQAGMEAALSDPRLPRRGSEVPEPCAGLRPPLQPRLCASELTTCFEVCFFIPLLEAASHSGHEPRHTPYVLCPTHLSQLWKLVGARE